MEPQFFEGELWLNRMPGTAKFADLRRFPQWREGGAERVVRKH